MKNAEMAILSLIAEAPRHGYEIEELIEARGMREWTDIGFSSIYYLLKKLEKGEFITSELQEASRGPARKVYSLTGSGRAALRTAVVECLSVPQRDFASLQLGLALLPVLKTEEAVAALQQHRRTLNAELTRLRSRKEADQEAPFFVQAMFDQTLTIIEAQLTWLNRFINELKDMCHE